MKNYSKIIAIICLSILVISCRKDDNEEVVASKTYLSKTTFANIGSDVYSYNEQNKLTNMSFTGVNPLYNPSYNLVIKTYEGEKIKTMLYDLTDPAKQDYDIVNTFDASGRLISQSYFLVNTNTFSFGSQLEYPSNLQVIVKRINDLGEVSLYDVYNYDAAKKNIIENKRYSVSNVLTFTYTFSGFDDKLSYHTLLPLGYTTTPQSQNNYSTYTYTPASGAATTYNFTYDYNADGYATKRTSSAGSFNSYEYIKK